MNKIKNFIKENIFLSVMIIILILVVLLIVILYFPDIKTKVDESNELSEEYWIYKDDYTYGINDEIVISNTTNVFQFLSDNKCFIVTLNGDDFYYDNKIHEIKKIQSRDIVKQGIWISNKQECTYEIKNNHIYINPLYGDNILYNGEYHKNGNKIEIIWNGEQKKSVFDKIKLKEDIKFYYTYNLYYKDLYEYDKFEYDVSSHVENGTFKQSMSVDFWINSIIKERNLNVSFEEFYDFNEALLANEFNLEYQIFFKDGVKKYYRFNEEDYNSIKNSVFELYEPIRKLSNDEIRKNISKEYNVPTNNIVMPDEIKLRSTVEIYITNVNTLKDYFVN